MRIRLLALATALPLLANAPAAVAAAAARPATASWPASTARSASAALDSREYTGGSTAVFITWDEGHGGTVGEKCATNTADESCHVATIVISPSTTPGTTSATLFNHYSLLRTAEQLLGLPLLGKAAGYPSMVAAFHL